MIKDAIRGGTPYPDKVKNAPELEPDEVFYFNAYQELSTTRRFEGGYIPWDAIHEYAQVYRVDTPDLAHVIMNLDTKFMLEASAKRKTGKNGKHAKQLGKMARQDRDER